MERSIRALALAAVFMLGASFTLPPVPDGDCSITDDLKIEGIVAVDETGESVLQGKIHNSSTYMEYSNVIIKADLCDIQGNVIASQAIELTEDIEKDEVEEFTIPVDAIAKVSGVEYTIVCADRDFAGLGY